MLCLLVHIILCVPIWAVFIRGSSSSPSPRRLRTSAVLLLCLLNLTRQNESRPNLLDTYICVYLSWHLCRVQTKLNFFRLLFGVTGGQLRKFKMQDDFNIGQRARVNTGLWVGTCWGQTFSLNEKVSICRCPPPSPYPTQPHTHTCTHTPTHQHIPTYTKKHPCTHIPA